MIAEQLETPELPRIMPDDEFEANIPEDDVVNRQKKRLPADKQSAEDARRASQPFMLNALGARGGSASALGSADLERPGGKRVSRGGSPSFAVLAFVQRTMRVLRKSGTLSFAQAALSNTRANAIMEKYRG